MEKHLNIFSAQDFPLVEPGRSSEGFDLPVRVSGFYVHPEALREMSAAMANAKVAPLIEAIQRMEGAGDIVLTVDENDELAARGAVATFMLSGRDILTAFRRLMGQENSGEVK